MPNLTISTTIGTGGFGSIDYSAIPSATIGPGGSLNLAIRALEQTAGARIAKASMKVPSVEHAAGRLPAGWTYSVVNEMPQVVVIGATDPVISGWDFTNCALLLGLNNTSTDFDSHITKVEDCHFEWTLAFLLATSNTEPAGGVFVSHQNAWETAAVEYCTIVGTYSVWGPALAFSWTSGGGDAPAPLYPRGATRVKKCHVTGLPFDGIRMSGNSTGEQVVIEENYFGKFANSPTKILPFDSETTYAKGDVVSAPNGQIFISRQGSNTNALPTSGSDAWWWYSDPHGDWIQLDNVDGGVLIEHNYIDMNGPGPNDAWDVVSGAINAVLFGARVQADPRRVVDEFIFRRNVTQFDAPGAQEPYGFNDGTNEGGWNGPVTIEDNALGTRAGGAGPAFSETGGYHMDVWQRNVGAVSGNTIAAPTILRGDIRTPAVTDDGVDTLTFTGTATFQSGTIHAVAIPTGDTAPSRAQIVAGQDSTGTTAPSGSQAISTFDAAIDIDITGLDLAEGWTVYAYHDRGDAIEQSVWTAVYTP